MNASPDFPDCTTCPGRLVCHCLQVTEDAIVSAIAVAGCETLRDLRKETGAGGGCTACQRKLRNYLERRVELAVVQA